MSDNANKIMHWLSSFKRGDELKVGRHLLWVELGMKKVPVYVWMN